MTELKLGNKYECFNCGAKFYDLGKGEPVCPKCGADQKDAEAKENPLVTQSVKRQRKAHLLADASEDAAAEVPVAEDLDDEDLEIELDEEELDEESAAVDGDGEKSEDDDD